MEHSPKYSMLKQYYNMKLWDERKMRDAVKKGWITAEEFTEITGKEY